jgi:hypothetical protein
MAGFVSLDGLFAGQHFDREIIILCVRWYLSFKLSFRDLVEMLAERGLPLAHTTIMRWVRHYAPEFERRWNHFARVVGACQRRLNLPQIGRSKIPQLGTRNAARVTSWGVAQAV